MTFAEAQQMLIDELHDRFDSLVVQLVENRATWPDNDPYKSAKALFNNALSNVLELNRAWAIAEAVSKNREEQ